MAGTSLIGVFEDSGQADLALTELRRAGFRDDQVGVMTRGPEELPASEDAEDLTVDPSPDGALAGALTGATLGGLLGAGMALLVPGVGPILAGGIVAATLGGAAVGATAGSLVGSMLEIDLTEDEAEYYEGELRAGRILAVVRPDGEGQAGEAAGILRRSGAVLADDTVLQDRPSGDREAGEIDEAPTDRPATGPIATPPIVTEPRAVAPSVLPPNEDDDRRGDRGQV